MESKKYTLNREDLERILIGGCIAVGGALLTYVAQTVANTDFGDLTPIVVAISSILINAGRKYLEGK